MAKVVMRLSYTAKVGRRDEVAELVKGLVERLGLTPRIYLSSFTCLDWEQVTSELVFDTEQQRREF